MDRKVQIKLWVTVLALVITPLVISYWLADDIVLRSLDVGFNPRVSALIVKYQGRLKELRTLVPAKTAELKADHAESREIEAVYDEGAGVKEALRKSLFTYFMLGLTGCLGVAAGMATVLSRSISRSFKERTRDLLTQRERIRYLEDIGHWQGVAQKLAHEIQGPLTPIDLLVTQLPRSLQRNTPEDFARELDECKRIVSEEVGRLRNMVHHFTAFAKLPVARLEPTDFATFVSQYIDSFGKTWPGARFETEITGPLPTSLDPALFKQVFANLFNNASQANPGQEVRIQIGLKREDQRILLEVKNSGRSIPSQNRGKLFQPYFTTKTEQDHLGLGLPIVKKIIVEHGGSITCLDLDDGAGFRIELPLSTGQTRHSGVSPSA